MAFKTLLLALAGAQAVTAHFGLVYPQWRADTLSAENEAKYSQYDYPCGGVPYGAGNITTWPLDGGSLNLSLHHPWTYVFVNLGLSANTTNFNISLTPEFLNVTGKGTLCIPKLPVPVDIQEGTLASLQVVTSGASGTALYNCADIRFAKNATLLPNCANSDGMVVQVIKQQTGNGTTSSGSGSTSSAGSQPTASAKSAAGILSANNVALTSVVGLATVFTLALSI